MKEKKYYLWLLGVLIVLTATDCASVYFIGSRSSGFNELPNPTIFYVAPLEDKPATRGLVALRICMKEKGFNLVDDPNKSNVIITYNKDGRLVDPDSSLLMLFGSEKKGTIGDTTFSGTTTSFAVVTNPKGDDFYGIDINMYLWKKNKDGNPKFTFVWRGYIDVYKSEFDSNPTYYACKLISKYGQEKEGWEKWW